MSQKYVKESDNSSDKEDGELSSLSDQVNEVEAEEGQILESPSILLNKKDSKKAT